MKNKMSLKLICLALVVALACGLAACKGFGLSRETADPDSGEEAASTPKTEILASLTDKELQGGFDLDELLDAACNILVLQSRSKTGAVYSNVERVFQS